MTQPTVLYNEIDEYAADWLENLIRAGHIAPGIVDRRSIASLEPDYVRRFTQCHFFAGIGVWSRALRLAGWPDDRPVWTGSCPCQPFSTAGKGKGHEDERHLWPAWQRLIRECAPPAVFGEQVASADGRGWLDVVLSDLENDSYAVAAADLSAAGFGAPHIRQRLFFVAHASDARLGRSEDTRADRGDPSALLRGGEGQPWILEPERVRADGLMAHAGSGSIRGRHEHREHAGAPGEARQQRVWADCGADGGAGLMADTEGRRLGQGSADAPGRDEGARAQGAGLGLADDCGGLMGDASDARLEGRREGPPAEGGWDGTLRPASEAGEPRSFWSACDWIPCRDGKARPVESRAQPLAHGLAARMGYVRSDKGWTLFPLQHGAENRVGRLRGYGNAIVAPVAAGFIEAAMPIVAPVAAGFVRAALESMTA